mmetsp:Transcript_24368/g.73195  ORF Transcript_24368/g.73195 Transcript_24368/m.73195 type:complete len:314 (+) Transcript_24368:1271-2212(+)
MQLAYMRPDQGGRTRGVDGHARAFQIQGVREAIRRDGVRGRCRAARPRQVDQAARAHAHPIVLVDADEVADVLGFPLQGALLVAALEEGHVRHLHDLALARVHAFGLRRGDLEESAIEQVNALDAEAAVPRVRAPVPVRVEVRTVVPPGERDLYEAVRGGLADAGPALPAAVGARPVAAIHPHDREVLSLRRRRAGAEPLQMRQIPRHLLEHVARRLAKQERRQGQRRARGRLVRVLEAAGHDEHHGVRLGLQFDLLRTLGGGEEGELAGRRTDELEERQLLADHGVEVALGVTVIEVGRLVAVLVPVVQRHP